MATDDSTAPPPPLRIGLPSRLGEMLIRQGLVTSEDVQAALAEQAAGSEWRLGRLLVRRGALDDRTLVQAIAHQFHVQVVDLRLEHPTPDALARLARGAALQLQALPLRLDADALVVAVADPPVRELRVAVERCTGLPVRLVLVAADELAAALDHWYGEDVDVTDAAMGADGTAAWPPPVAPVEPDPSEWDPFAAPGASVPLAESDPLAEPAPPDGPEVPGPFPDLTDLTDLAEPGDPGESGDLQMVVGLLAEAVRRDATAVHLDHSAEGLRIRYRVDGVIVAGPSLPRASGTVVCHRLLAAAALDPADDGLHEGAFDTVVDGRSITCRVTALATARGTHVVVRTEAAVRAGRLEDLRVAGNDARALRAILREGRGVLVAASAMPAGAVDAARTLVDEVGPEEHVVVAAFAGRGVELPGAVALDPGTDADGVIAAARALGADVLVTDATDHATRRAAFDAAAGLLVVLVAPGDDPSDIVAVLVADAGAFLVAGMLRAVLVVGSDPGGVTADVHLVTEDVCRAILDLPHP